MAWLRAPGIRPGLAAELGHTEPPPACACVTVARKRHQHNNNNRHGMYERRRAALPKRTHSGCDVSCCRFSLSFVTQPIPPFVFNSAMVLLSLCLDFQCSNCFHFQISLANSLDWYMTKSSVHVQQFDGIEISVEGQVLMQFYGREIVLNVEAGHYFIDFECTNLP